jgi:hypothetical protein
VSSPLIVQERKSSHALSHSQLGIFLPDFLLASSIVQLFDVCGQAAAIIYQFELQFLFP